MNQIASNSNGMASVVRSLKTPPEPARRLRAPRGFKTEKCSNAPDLHQFLQELNKNIHRESPRRAIGRQVQPSNDHPCDRMATGVHDQRRLPLPRPFGQSAGRCPYCPQILQATCSSGEDSRPAALAAAASARSFAFARARPPTAGLLASLENPPGLPRPDGEAELGRGRKGGVVTFGCATSAGLNPGAGSASTEPRAL